MISKSHQENSASVLIDSKTSPVGHHKSLSVSSVIEDDGEKFYSPLTKKESNNSSNYSDLDAVRQILVSPDLLATSPKKKFQVSDSKSLNSLSKPVAASGFNIDKSNTSASLIVNSPEPKRPMANQHYTPLIKDIEEQPSREDLSMIKLVSAFSRANGNTDFDADKKQKQGLKTAVAPPLKSAIQLQALSPKTGTEIAPNNDANTDEDNDGEETDNATIRSGGSSSSNISNKTEKALKYEEMKVMELRNTASELYGHSYNEVPVEEYLNVLCDPSNPNAKKLRSLYLKKFEWNISLLDSLRILCNKLYFRGESQNISRIIESFSVVWTQKFPKNIFGNQYAVYLIAYSLILLNSDLHSPELSKHISKETFVKNTLNALKVEKLYPKDSLSALNCLRNYYESIELHELKLLGTSPSPTTQISNYSHNNSSFVNLRKTSFNVSRSANRNTIISTKLYPSPHSGSGDSHMLRPSTDGYALENGSNGSKFSTVHNNQSKEQQPVGFLHALQRGSSQLGSRLDKDLKKHKSTASITSALSSNTMKTVETSNTFGTYNSITTSNKSSFKHSNSSHGNKAKGGGSTGIGNGNNNGNVYTGGIVNSSSFTSSSLEASDVIIEEDEADMELELTGPPWAKEGLLKIKKFDKNKNFFGINTGKSANSLSNSGSAHFGKNFFNSNNGEGLLSNNNPLSRTSTNTSSIAKSYKNYTHYHNSNSSNNLLKWKLNFTVVSRGELKLFSFNSKVSSSSSQYNLSSTSTITENGNSGDSGSSSSKLRKKFSKLRLDRSNEPVVVGAGNAIPIGSGIGDGNWMRNAISSGTFGLVSTYSKIIPDDSINNKSLKSKELETFWALKLPGNYDFETDNRNLVHKVKKETSSYINNDNILIFSAGTREIAEEYVFTCNYWAARLTAIPTQTESISNKEYGWGALLHKKSVTEIMNVKIHKWEPLIPSIISSTLSIKKQLIELFKYVQQLENLISDHLKIKDQIDEFIHLLAAENPKYLVQLNKVFNSIMSNWNNKYTYLVNEHNQFKDYVLTLKEAIDLKQKKLNEDEDDD